MKGVTMFSRNLARAVAGPTVICLAIAALITNTAAHPQPNTGEIDLESAEQAAILLSEFARDKLQAECRYNGALGAGGQNRRKLLRSAGKFTFQGDKHVWGETFWTCRLSVTRTGTPQCVELKLPNEKSLWIELLDVAVDYNVADWDQVQSHEGTKLIDIFQQLPAFSEEQNAQQEKRRLYIESIFPE